MSRFVVYGVVVVLAAAPEIVSAQTPVTNSFGDAHLTFYPALTGSDPLPGTWAPTGQYTDQELRADSEMPILLLGSFDGASPAGEWPLVLTNVDFGEQEALAQWGPVVTVVPEPCASTLLALGGVAAAACLLRRQHSRGQRPI